ncbi:hypothetical protein [Streptomyces ipomoeae]|uniref:hypothetical protein n=1 Tax=Streptomyces ipomoeae TaxID=103232 RepID=UPI0029BA39B3|nr:hypothetical protein [Streptomyces ipomoeae]MDX2697159.1 hypothetical protein [Streptomyces ipomoeae]MDX2843069.1 hypothetical protein [Streptomyces ipomoeae]
MTETHESGAKVIRLPFVTSPDETATDTVEDTTTDATVDLSKDTPAAPAAPAAPVEGSRIITAEEWALAEDPEGDAPWINPALLTPEGRAARAAYLQRTARRRARRWARRQWTPRGIVPATVRGGVRIHRWVRGVEGRNAEAARQNAEMRAEEAERAARRAKHALLNRDKKQKAAEVAQQQSQLALTQATAATELARRRMIWRGLGAYGPLAGIDVAGAVFMDGLIGLGTGLLVNLVVLARVGARPDMDPEALEELERQEAGLPDRFEIGMTPRAFEAMLHQALTEEIGIAVHSLRINPHKWGFEVQLVLKNQTPEKLSENLGLLEACLPGVRTNSALLQQSAAARNECTLRIPGDDPWQAVPELPYRAPKSISTHELHEAQIGADMSGRGLALPGKRTSTNTVGKPRSGKSTVLRARLDALTATSDRIIVGIDLGSYGAGFGPYAKCMAAVARTPREARTVLEWALEIGVNRPKLFQRLGMGANWEASPEYPGITVVIDEFPALWTAAKAEVFPKPKQDDEFYEKPMKLDELVRQIHLTSSKSDVVLDIATHSVTKEKIGDNTWLGEVPVQVMGACDRDDIVQIVGKGAMAQGWRADRLLPAMGDAVNDASVVYVSAGATYAEPIPYRACITSDEEADRRATERAEAGQCELDAGSKAFVRGIELPNPGGGDPWHGDDDEDDEETVPVLLQVIRKIYAARSNPSGLTEDELFDALHEVEPETWDLDRIEGETDITKGAFLALVLEKVLAPRGQRWAKESYRPKGAKSTVKGYRLKDLKILVGEADDS